MIWLLAHPLPLSISKRYRRVDDIPKTEKARQLAEGREEERGWVRS
jgi:hypothetical protein